MTKVTLPEGYKPSESEEYMNPMHLEYFKIKLLAWKQELLDESNLTLDHLQEENWHEPDFNDRAMVETDASIELRTRDRYRKLIEKIDEALDRIKTGEYGYCEETGDEIGLKRLEARPVATLCIEAQEKHEKQERQFAGEADESEDEE
jgi:DnaK suppressor protein